MACVSCSVPVPPAMPRVPFCCACWMVRVPLPETGPAKLSVSLMSVRSVPPVAPSRKFRALARKVAALV